MLKLSEVAVRKERLWRGSDGKGDLSAQVSSRAVDSPTQSLPIHLPLFVQVIMMEAYAP
jgi:hypothetical protein